jgi:GNAT superfamily N-acetyltransferase
MTADATIAVRVRPAVPNDLPICAALDHSTNTDYVWQMEYSDPEGGLNVGFRTARLPRTMRVLYPRGSAALESSWEVHAGFLVAELGHKIVGYVNMREQRAYETGWVADLAVEEGRRGQGIGTRLLGAARAAARELGLRRIIAETATKNYPSICFLQKSGLVFCGYNDLYYPNHDIALFFGQSLR